MAILSLNVNKIATLRNSRGTNQPDLLEAVNKALSYGVKGITVHPRPDGRHILNSDVKNIKKLLNHPSLELNVEGYPNTEFLQLMEEVKPHQCTLVPDSPSVLTSDAGWKLENSDFLNSVHQQLKKNKIRTSLFIDPRTLTEKKLSLILELKTDRVELFTGPYAKAYWGPQKDKITQTYALAAQKLHEKGIGLNAGHDLNLENLAWFLDQVPHIQEVSIGHALICEALYEGLEKVIKNYLKICAGKSPRK